MKYTYISTDKNILSICKNNFNYFLNIKNVIGTGLGYKVTNGFYTNEKCIKVFVTKKFPTNKLCNNEMVPQFFQGIPTDIVEVGVPTPCSLTSKIRPVLGGYSIGPLYHNKLLSGTMGCLVKDSHHLYLLSCNHILADENRLPLDTGVIQPSIEDSGTPFDLVAVLSKFIPLEFSSLIHKPTNYVDCAIAELRKPSLASADITYIGKPKGIKKATLNESVQKVGKTTEKTNGTVTSIGVTMALNYDYGSVLFKDLIITTKMSQKGDSGSLLLDSNKYALGLLCCDSPVITCYNDIDKVLTGLNVHLITG